MIRPAWLSRRQKISSPTLKSSAKYWRIKKSRPSKQTTCSRASQLISSVRIPVLPVTLLVPTFMPLLSPTHSKYPLTYTIDKLGLSRCPAWANWPSLKRLMTPSVPISLPCLHSSKGNSDLVYHYPINGTHHTYLIMSPPYTPYNTSNTCIISIPWRG